MKRSFERLVSGLLVVAMLMAMPVVSMASEWTAGSGVAAYSATEIIPACDHNFNGGDNNLIAVTVAPTCETGGYTQYTCKLCGQVYKGNYTPMLGHNYEPYGAPQGGQQAYRCSTCGAMYAVSLTDAGIESHYHFLSTDAGSTLTKHVKKATCGENDYGYAFYDCSQCGFRQYDAAAYEAPLAHDYTDWQFVTESSMAAKGLASRKCRTCGFVEYVKTQQDAPSAKKGRIKTDFVPVYADEKSNEAVLFLAKGVTFDCANEMYGTRYKVQYFMDPYGESKFGEYYVESKNVELDPGSVPVYTAYKGIQEIATVKTDASLSVYSGYQPNVSAMLTTLTSGNQVYVYRYDNNVSKNWGRIDAAENKWINLQSGSLNRIPAFGFGQELSDLSAPDPVAPEVADVGTVTAASSVIVRLYEGGTSVGKLPNGTRITFYKLPNGDGPFDDVYSPFKKDAKGNIIRGYIDKTEAARLGLADAGFIDMSYVVLDSGNKTGTAGGTTAGTGTTAPAGNAVVATGVVTSSVNLNVRKEPKVSVLNLMGSLRTGSKLEFYEIGTHNGASWGRIKYNGNDGWVCMTYVQITSGNTSAVGSGNTAAKPNGTVANCSVGVNVRDSSSVKGKLLSTIAVNSRVAVTKLENGWGFVDGKGWVYMQYVRLDAGAEEAIKNGTAAGGSTNTGNTGSAGNGAIQTYTNVTVLGKVASGKTATIYPTTLQKPGTEMLTMVSGREFTITDRTIVNGVVWFKTSSGGYTGWVADINNNVELPQVVGTVNVDKLNVYADRSTDSTVINTLVVNSQVTIVKNGQRTDGVYVWGELKSGGYVQMNNLKLVIQASKDKGISVGATPITGTVRVAQTVYKQPDSTSEILYEVKPKHAVSIDTWYYNEDDGNVWAKVTVGEEAGWLILNTTNVAQNSVSATVSVDKVELYTTAGDLASKVGLTKRKNDKLTVLERTLKGSTVWGRVTVSDKNGQEDYWMNLAGTTLGTYSIVPTTTTAPTVAPTTGAAGSAGTVTASVKGTVANTDYVNVRSGAGVGNPVATTLAKGTVVTVYEQKTVDNALWGRIDQGWVAMSYIDLSSKAPTGGTVSGGTVSGGTVSGGSVAGNTILTSVPSDAIAVGFVNTKNLNVRNGSGFGYTTTATLPQYTNVVVYEQILKDGVIWARIDQGWVCATYLTYTGLSVTGSGTAGTVARCFYTARLRANPGVNSALVGYVMVNSRLEVYEQQSYSGEMWGRTSIGWISMQYVLTDGTLPV